MIMCDTRLTFEELTPEEQAKVEEFQNKTGLKVLEFGRQEHGIRPTLINGKPVDRTDWAEVVRIGGGS